MPKERRPVPRKTSVSAQLVADLLAVLSLTEGKPLSALASALGRGRGEVAAAAKELREAGHAAHLRRAGGWRLTHKGATFLGTSHEGGS